MPILTDFFSLYYFSHLSDSFHCHIKLLFSRLDYCSGLLTRLYEIHIYHIHFPKHNSSEVRLKKIMARGKGRERCLEKFSQDEFRRYLVVQVTPFLENKILLLGRASSILKSDPSSSFNSSSYGGFIFLAQLCNQTFLETSLRISDLNCSFFLKLLLSSGSSSLLPNPCHLAY